MHLFPSLRVTPPCRLLLHQNRTETFRTICILEKGIRSLNGGGPILGIEDVDGFFQVSISTTGRGLAAGQSYALDESNPITQTGIFYLAGALVANAPPLKTGTM